MVARIPTKPEILKDVFGAAQEIANNIARREEEWGLVRKKVLCLQEGEEPVRQEYAFFLAKEIPTAQMVEILKGIAEKKYAGREYPYWTKDFSRTGGGADLLWPGHYTAFIDKVYVDKTNLLVLFLRNRRDLRRADVRGSLDREAQEIFRQISSQLI
jgi:hypothetical protein